MSHWGDYILERDVLSSVIKCKPKDHVIDYILTNASGETLNRVVIRGLCKYLKIVLT